MMHGAEFNAYQSPASLRPSSPAQLSVICTVVGGEAATSPAASKRGPLSELFLAGAPSLSGLASPICSHLVYKTESERQTDL